MGHKTVKIRILSAVLALTVSASSASATIVDAIYKGVITVGEDNLGFFGHPAQYDYYNKGDAVQIIFEFDTTKGVKLSNSTGTFIGGGPGDAPPPNNTYPTPVLKTIVTINGISYPSFAGTNIGQIWGERAPQYDEFQQLAWSEVGNADTGFVDNVQANIWNWTASSSIPGTIDVPLTYAPGPGDGSQFNIWLDGGEVFLSGPLTSVQYTIPSGAGGVPEPSTWAMMLLGFAGLGFAGYRRVKAGRATLGA